MKKIMVSLLFAFAGFAFANTATAQVRVGVNINIGDQPEWGPAGYDYAEYYYMPAIETYYSIPRRQFVYFSGGRWIFSSSLPPRYANYDLYSGYKVVLRPNDSYRHFDDHRVRYARYRTYNDRQVILRSRHDNGNHYGQYKNKGRNGWGHGKGHY
ncbi:MAG TPA: hypothetical protein VHL77_03625 [Ferruginibacter sp.]|jgi:hypothetical protein|nr:hypothetical protein [Ferruginibacter sp.]